MRVFLLLGLFAALSGYARQPNVVVILTDDQGYGDMSCHGNPVLKTPEIDRLAAEGVRFEDFHVDPTCAPTRAALMTGRYASRVGVWLTYGSRHHLRRDEVTMADIFSRNGYRTAVYGKWHLGDSYPFRPHDRGFDDALIHGGGIVGETPDHWDNNYYDDTYFRNGRPEKVKGYCTDVWFNEAIQFMESNRERPFFIYLPTNAAHSPYHVPSAYADPYKKDAKKRAKFYGMIANLDENIGRFRARLKELSLERDTILVFMTDNGTAGGARFAPVKNDGWVVEGYNAGMRGRKSSAYEGGHRAACFMVWPSGNLTGGRSINTLSSHIDLLPTFVDLCGLTVKGGLPFDGVSLRPLLSGDKKSFPPRSIVVHHQGRFLEDVKEGLLIKGKDFSVMRGHWRLVGAELYDLSTDPSQRQDVAAQHPEMVQRLQGDYETWWSGISRRSDEFAPYVINPSKQNTVMISTQNLLGSNVAYSQRHVREAKPGQGWTMIDVEVPGRYQISLRRWPRESGLHIHASAPPVPMDPATHSVKKTAGRVVNAVAARLRVGEFDQTARIGETTEEVSFEVSLEKRQYRIQGDLIAESGDAVFAYYLYIDPLPPAHP